MVDKMQHDNPWWTIAVPHWFFYSWSWNKLKWPLSIDDRQSRVGLL